MDKKQAFATKMVSSMKFANLIGQQLEPMLREKTNQAITRQLKQPLSIEELMDPLYEETKQLIQSESLQAAAIDAATRNYAHMVALVWLDFYKDLGATRRIALADFDEHMLIPETLRSFWDEYVARVHALKLSAPLLNQAEVLELLRRVRQILPANAVLPDCVKDYLEACGITLLT